MDYPGVPKQPLKQPTQFQQSTTTISNNIEPTRLIHCTISTTKHHYSILIKLNQKTGPPHCPKHVQHIQTPIQTSQGQIKHPSVNRRHKTLECITSHSYVQMQNCFSHLFYTYRRSSRTLSNPKNILTMP